MLVRDAMTAGATVVPPGATVLQAARILLTEQVSSLPVVEPPGKVVGVVSEGDLIRCLSASERRPFAEFLSLLIGTTSAAEFIGARGKSVREVMSFPPLTIEETDPLEEALALIERHKVKSIPVMREDQLVGILSRRDLLRAAVRMANKADGVGA